ncbi:branched-chain amino acid ABC transporter permease [Candidatus Peregrinibacteria bacterium]|nr:branched-chain amino acid ABC transporter permease [Candidatus Peregrinibacteria bacterium]
MFVLQILLTSLVTGTQVLLLAAGLYLIYTVTRTVHIALGASTIAGGYAYYVGFQMGLPWYACLAFGLAFSALLGLLCYFLIKPYIQKSQVLLALLVSIALGVALEAALALVFGPEGRYLMDGVLPVFDFWGVRVTQVGLYTLLVGLFTGIIAYIFLHVLPLGRVVRAIAQHPQCASLMGIKERRVQMVIYIVAGVVAGIMGILTGLNGAITPYAGLQPISMAFMALLVGGLTDFRGVALASYLLVLIPELIVSGNFGEISFSSSWKMVFVFVISLAVLALKPNGIFSSVTRKS